MTSNVLGQQVASPHKYSPEILVRIRREPYQHIKREDVVGFDDWNSYEFSWLDVNGKPQVRGLKITIPQHSTYIVESKSLKLYLNSFYNETIESEQKLVDTIISDLSLTLGIKQTAHSTPFSCRQVGNNTDLNIQLMPVDDLPPTSLLTEQCLEHCFQQNIAINSNQLYTHLFRSLCPVTAQPDWASVIFQFDKAITSRMQAQQLLDIVLSYRNHQAFHEHCVELMFEQLKDIALTTNFSVQALFCRRGGIDINPYRATAQQLKPFQGRSMRQ